MGTPPGPSAPRPAARLLGAAVLLTSCSAPEPEPETSPACRALADAARRGARCDPALAQLAEQTEREASARGCRRAIRHLLDDAPYDGQSRSIYAQAEKGDADPLTPDELERLTQLPLPGRLRLRVGSNSPGLAAVRLDGERLAPAPDRGFDVHTSPGPHRLEITALGERGVHCLVVPTCGELVLDVRGVHLSDEDDRPFVSDAACGRDPAALELTSAERNRSEP